MCFRCKRCGKYVIVNRSTIVDKDVLWEDLQRIGKEDLLSHVMSEHPDKTFNVFEPNPPCFEGEDDEDFDMDALIRIEKELGISLLYPLATSVHDGKLFYLM